MPTCGQNYHFLQTQINEIARQHGRQPQDIQLIAVSKTHSEEAIREVYQAGALFFGESRVQEAFPKVFNLPKEIHWHLIGSLQANKISKAYKEIKRKGANEGLWNPIV